MSLDVQVEGMRIAKEFDHLRETSSVESQKPLNALFILAVKGFALGWGLILGFICFWILEAQEAFIAITCISFATIGLVVGGRKIAQLLSPLQKRLFMEK